MLNSPHTPNKHRLNNRIILIGIIAILLTGVSISILGVDNLKKSILNDLEVSASMAGERNAAPLAFRDNEAVITNLDVFSAQRSIIRACLYDDLGDIFARYPDGPRTVTCPSNIRPRSLIGSKNIEVMKDIIRNNDRIGSIYIESNMQQVDLYVAKQITIGILITIAIAILYIFLLLKTLRHTVRRPC